MPAILITILTWFSRALIIQAFKYCFTAVLGLASWAFMQRLINKYINQFLSDITGIDSISMLMSLSRLDDALSIIVGALTVKVAIKSMGLRVVPFT